MARLPRLALAGHVHHVLQRGNNRQPVCVDPADFQALLSAIHESAKRFSVAVHAYVLLPDHFHLLVTPQEGPALPLMMQALGRQYVRYFNDRHGRTGTLWDGRFKSTVLQSERFGLAAMVFTDLHAVRTGLVSAVENYPWSSHAHYSGLQVDKLITPLPDYWRLGNTPFAREAAYTQLVQEGISSVQIEELAHAVTRGWALGEPDFLDALQKTTGRRLSKRSQGRPVGAHKASES
jgi:putative transposase